MAPSIVARRAAQIRDLLDRGAFGGARVPLRNGGTLPAALFAKIALGDLDHLGGVILIDHSACAGGREEARQREHQCATANPP